MQTQGILVMCPRCEKTFFRERYGEFENIERCSAMDSDFKPIPDDWLNVPEIGGHLCPECAYEFKKKIYDFMFTHKERIADGWR